MCALYLSVHTFSVITDKKLHGTICRSVLVKMTYTKVRHRNKKSAIKYYPGPTKCTYKFPKWLVALRFPTILNAVTLSVHATCEIRNYGEKLHTFSPSDLYAATSPAKHWDVTMNHSRVDMLCHRQGPGWLRPARSSCEQTTAPQYESEWGPFSAL